jgi:pimeloyl-ACP methyl ester carboxylesterase
VQSGTLVSVANDISFRMMRNPLKSAWDGTLPSDPEKAILGVRESSARIEVDGAVLAWAESGEGVPVVCLHAAGHGARDFSLLEHHAPANCRLLLIDWPGHGRSSGDSSAFGVERCTALLAGFLNAQGLRNAILLGTEFGAAVALAFAMQHPARVRGLVLCQPSGLLNSSESRSRPGRFVRPGTKTLLRRPALQPAEIEEKQVEALASKHALACDQAARSLLALEETLRGGLAQVRCPVLIALSARSAAYPLKPMLRFLEPLLNVAPLDQPGQAKLAIFPGRSSPLWESPERMANMLSGFACATQPLDAHTHAWTLTAADWPSRGMNQWQCTHPGCRASLALPIEENPNRAQR